MILLQPWHTENHLFVTTMFYTVNTTMHLKFNVAIFKTNLLTTTSCICLRQLPALTIICMLLQFLHNSPWHGSQSDSVILPRSLLLYPTRLWTYYHVRNLLSDQLPAPNTNTGIPVQPGKCCCLETRTCTDILSAT